MIITGHIELYLKYLVNKPPSLIKIDENENDTNKNKIFLSMFVFQKIIFLLIFEDADFIIKYETIIDIEIQNKIEYSPYINELCIDSLKRSTLNIILNFSRLVCRKSSDIGNIFNKIKKNIRIKAKVMSRK